MLLEIGAQLMSSGADTARIRKTSVRIARALGCQAELLVTPRAIVLTVSDKDGKRCHSELQRTAPQVINFRVVSAISRMSWRAQDEQWSLAEVQDAVASFDELPRYSRLQVLCAVGLAGTAFCRLLGGGAVEMGVAFVATVVGLFVRQTLVKLRHNDYLCIFAAAVSSGMIAGLAIKLNLGERSHYALATCVLYLVPGVPLINSASDFIDGNHLNGVLRGVHGLIISFAIAAGLLLSLLVFRSD